MDVSHLMWHMRFITHHLLHCEDHIKACLSLQLTVLFSQNIPSFSMSYPSSQLLNIAWKLHLCFTLLLLFIDPYNACIVWKHTSVIPVLFTKTVNKREAPLSPKPQFLLSSNRASISFEDEVILWIMLYNSNAQPQISRRIMTDGTNRRNHCRDGLRSQWHSFVCVDLQIVNILFKCILSWIQFEWHFSKKTTVIIFRAF